MNDLLTQYFGYDKFRPGQKEIIQKVIDQENVLGIMPTGSGKSICYQLPSLLLDGLTVVVSPLISDEGSGGCSKSIRYTRHFYQ